MGPVQRKVTYRLYPRKRQEEGLRQLLGRHQRLYNAALEQRISAYRRQGKTVSFAEQCRDLTALRGEDPEYGGVNAQSCQVTLKRLDLAFKHFFRRVRESKSKAGFPRFKSLRRFSGWGYKTHGDGWRLQAGEGMKHGRVRLSGVGNIRIRGKARTEGTPKTLEVMHKQGRWYASVTVVCEPRRARVGNGAAGLDWGVETFATVANEDGTTQRIENPRHLQQARKDLTAAQRDLSRKKRGSRNRDKARQKVTSLHRKVANRRHDFLHQQSAALVATLAVLATEKLQVSNMTRSAKGTAEAPGKNVRQKAGLNRSILDTAPAAFLQMLKYKAEEAGTEWVEVPTRQVKPSQTCHGCGQQRKKPLAERQHRCECGACCSRDENAARVMLAWATGPPGREPSWCGGGALAPPVKHETPSIAA
jgi:putative transposase